MPRVKKDAILLLAVSTGYCWFGELGLGLYVVMAAVSALANAAMTSGIGRK